MVKVFCSFKELVSLRFRSRNTKWFGLEGTFTDHLVQLLNHSQSKNVTCFLILVISFLGL